MARAQNFRRIFPVNGIYADLLNSRCGSLWKKIGIKRRAGVMAPLFSIQSSQSVGVGEIPDLELLADWCRDCGMSLIQLLPLNDVGDRFCPYDAESSFALDPLHLSLSRLSGISARKNAREIETIRAKFPSNTLRFDTRVKQEKIIFLEKVFLSKAGKNSKEFEIFKQENAYWLEDYALFKILKNQMGGKSWQDWPDVFKNRELSALSHLKKDKENEIEFQMWVQWQLSCQLKKTASILCQKGVWLMGDLPFLVARDSADVWAHPEFFKLDLAAGAPPDLYFADGQEWGMPPYHWSAMAASEYVYLKQKMKYAANFYNLFRIDHFVGIFRVWTFPKFGGADRKSKAAFDPPDESVWEKQGRQALDAMLEGNPMLPCAEDLGVVPDQAKKLLKEYGIPGMEIQRWMRNWETDAEFISPQKYRANAIATLSTHDMSPVEVWWKYEAGTVDGALVRKKFAETNISFDAQAANIFVNPEGEYGRLRWGKRVCSKEDLCSVLRRPQEHLSEIQDLHRTTFDEKQKYWNFLGLKEEAKEDLGKAALEKAIEKCSQSASIFCIHSIQDLLALDQVFGPSEYKTRFNQPGIVDENNWRLRSPVNLEKMRTLPSNRLIKKIHEATERI